MVGGLRKKGINRKKNDKPLVTVVTPVYNGERYLEDTIKSILSQTYDNIEYILIDGGSTDGTLDIIRKYEDNVDYWVSERDKGQTDAINKGFSLAKGEILIWLNYDDIFYTDTVQDCVNVLWNKPYSFTYGHCNLINEKGEAFSTLYTCRQTLKSYQHDNGNIFQGTVFFKAELWEKYGPLDGNVRCTFEYKLFDSFFKHEKGAYINKVIAKYRIHSDAISSNYGHLSKEEQKQYRTVVDNKFYKFYFIIRRNFLNLLDGNLCNKLRKTIEKREGDL